MGHDATIKMMPMKVFNDIGKLLQMTFLKLKKVRYNFIYII